MPKANKMICPDCGVEMNHHADKVDYINRDAQICGIPVGIDVARLFLRSSFVAYEAVIPSGAKTVGPQRSEARSQTCRVAVSKKSESRTCTYSIAHHSAFSTCWRRPDP